MSDQKDQPDSVLQRSDRARKPPNRLGIVPTQPTQSSLSKNPSQSSTTEQSLSKYSLEELQEIHRKCDHQVKAITTNIETLEEYLKDADEEYEKSLTLEELSRVRKSKKDLEDFKNKLLGATWNLEEAKEALAIREAQQAELEKEPTKSVSSTASSNSTLKRKQIELEKEQKLAQLKLDVTRELYEMENRISELEEQIEDEQDQDKLEKLRSKLNRAKSKLTRYKAKTDTEEQQIQQLAKLDLNKVDNEDEEQQIDDEDVFGDSENVDKQVRAFVEPPQLIPTYESTWFPPQHQPVQQTCYQQGASAIPLYAPTPIQAPPYYMPPQYQFRYQGDRRLPEFSGDPAKWKIFQKAFVSTTSKYRICEVENLSRLNQALKSEARRHVEYMMTEPSNVGEIMKLLERRFGNPKHVIQFLIENVRKAKAPDINKPQSIIDYGIAVATLVTQVKTYQQEGYLHDVHLVAEIEDKLPVNLRDRWHDFLLDDTNRTADLRCFAIWMDRQVRRAEMGLKPDVFVEKQEKRFDRGRERGERKFERNRDHRRGAVHAATEKEATTPRKKFCNVCRAEGHFATECVKFKSMNVDERWKVVIKHKLCFNCLRSKHSAKECRSKDRCGEKGCKRRHYKLLHGKEEKENASAAKDDDEDEETDEESDDMNRSGESQGEANSFASVNVGMTAALPIIPVILSGPSGSIKVNALVDSGSTCTILEEDIAGKIGLEGETSPFNLIVFGKDTRREKSRIVSASIKGFYSKSPTFKLNRIRTVFKLGIPGASIDPEDLKNKYPYLKKMVVKSCSNAVPQMVIGCDNSRLFAAREILESSKKNTPCAYRSLLGWYVCGTQQTRDSFNAAVEEESDENLHEIVKQFFALENIGVVNTKGKKRSKEDKIALQMMEKNIRKGPNNRYESGLLWRNEDCDLPESRRMAERRLHSMEDKMDRDPEFAKLVEEKFEDYISRGFLKRAKINNSSRKWYLPWFFAYHPSKSPRLIFDAAAKSNGKCLNDFLLTGPDLLNSLPEVLLRFRSYLIGLKGDVEKMFHQVERILKEWSCQIILYRGKDRSKPPVEYVMTVLFFGAVDSPSCAIYAQQENAKEFAQIFPLIVEKILTDFYFDDMCSGGEDDDETLELQQRTTEIHAAGEFPMTKWISSSESVHNKIPKEIRAERKAVSFNQKSEKEYEKTLGLLWDPVEDEFVLKLTVKQKHEKIFRGEQVPTKREVISILASQFDPLGFIAPLKIKGLIQTQEIWKSGIGWDDEIPSNLREPFKEWIEDLKKCSGVKIKRKLSSRSLKVADELQLHVLVDASEEAYAASAFLRVQTRGSVECSFLIGKSRVAPIRQKLTIPKMELEAAVLGVKIAKVVKKAYDKLSIKKTVYWSDSRTVLCWLRSTTGRFNRFVSARIDKVLLKSDASDWRWIPTLENSSDAATRSGRIAMNKWLNAPEFLFSDEIRWPVEVIQKKQEVEEDIETAVAVVDKTKEKLTELEDVLPPVERYSSWFKLIRSTARIFYLARKVKKIGPAHLSIKDLEKAKVAWIKKSQRESFAEAIRQLRKNGVVDEKNSLFKLSPKLNQDGVIVLNSRLQNAEGSASLKQPPILSPDEDYTKLLVKWFHYTSQHYGQERIINEIRKHVWVIGCRNAVRQCKSKCIICQRRSLIPEAPLMGQLPASRVESGHPAFHCSGVDYFGPLFVTNKRSVEKRWGVIFTCHASRAVHLDIAQSLDTADMINTYARFINIRGKVARMWSDNGTNFVGGEREMREKLEAWNKDEIIAAMQIKGVEWSFLPARSPHMGGSHERLIQDVKKILKVMLKENHPQEDILRTFLAEVTGIMNSRPITTASPNPDDPRCLTPNDLLNIPIAIGGSVPGDYPVQCRYKKAWERVQRMSREFWERWSIEYLPWLARRSKWLSPKDPLKVGDIVIVLEDNAPRNDWKKGIIVKVYTAQDGQVRSADVEIAHVDPEGIRKDLKRKPKISVLRRPAVKICKLSSTDEKPIRFERENVAE